MKRSLAMKNSVSRQHIYIIVLSLFLSVFVLIFSFGVLIPKGKEYRLQRNELQKIDRLLRKKQDFQINTILKLKKLQKSNRRVIKAFDTAFDPEYFEKENKKFFSKLSIKSVNLKKTEKNFTMYEVNASSQIDSPTSFYKFLDALNKSNWIVKVQFPIKFQHEAGMINSSFKLQIYCNNRETNASTSAFEAK